jgi:hypothetical protein
LRPCERASPYTLPRVPPLRSWTCLVACALVLGACGGDDETGQSTETTDSGSGGATPGQKDTPTFDAVKKVALAEIDSCPGQSVRQQISRAGQRQRGIVEFPTLYCDELPVVWYVRYEDEAARERDSQLVDPKTVEIPYFVNANVFATALLTADAGPRQALPDKIKQACGCGEVVEPAR